MIARLAPCSRHYRSGGFAVLLVAYLAVLFGVCTLHDSHQASRVALRVLAPCFELALAALVCAGCVRLQRRFASAWWLLPAAVAFVQTLFPQLRTHLPD